MILNVACTRNKDDNKQADDDGVAKGYTNVHADGSLRPCQVCKLHRQNHTMYKPTVMPISNTPLGAKNHYFDN